MKPIELTDEILLNVRKPARYTGREHNMIKKDWSDDMIKICISYPDVYEIGMSHLGLKILYDLLNKQEDVLCERTFTPWVDMEESMLKEKIPLFSLESQAELLSFDIVGFSLQHELNYTNLLTMLNLSKIPFYAKEREGGDFPLIIAGGTCAFNPEPLSQFIDAFIVGDGEEVIIDIVDLYRKYKQKKIERKDILKEIAEIEGVYVSSIDSSTKRIKKRVIKNLKDEYAPTRPIVPNMKTVHDRITLEIMRGCPNKCSFCQATQIYSPVRIRDHKDIEALAKESYKNTGLDEMSLLSLSSSNYPQIGKLIKNLQEHFAPLGVGLSLPSLRIEEQIDKMPSLISTVKKSGLTFAPEVGTKKMQQVINKHIDFEQFFSVLRKAYEFGWRKIKLYFMIGLPEEDDNDVEAIIDLADKAANLRREVSSHPAEVTVSVSSFIPKPHTPFERLPMVSKDEIIRKQNLLKQKVLKKRYLRLKYHNTETSILEGIFSRGDKKLAAVLESAWNNGARFDAWDELFRHQVWQKAFSDNNIDEKAYLLGFDPDTQLPWSYVVT